MRYRQLGRTGLRVSEIGFGAWGIGGDSYGSVDDGESCEALLKAFERGITLFDTADLYGAGHSETLIGRTLRPVRDCIVLATKGGTLPHSGFYMPQDFSATHLAKALDASLLRLGTDHVDLYQLHSPELPLSNSDEIKEFVRNAKDSGKIGLFGVSVRSPADALVAIRELGAQCVQLNFNLLDQRCVESGVLDQCEKAGVGVIARTPLCFGFLSGNLSGNETFGSRDHRRNWPREQLVRWAEGARLFEGVAATRGLQLSQLALLYCLSPLSVSSVIPGMLNRSEVLMNASIAEMPALDAATVGRLRELYRLHNFYDAGAKSPGKAQKK